MSTIEQQAISESRFGKDHWSMLAYAQSCCVNGKEGFGTLDNRKMRANEKTHPLLAVNQNSLPLSSGWQPSWGTRLHGFFEERDAALQLPDHDDWDCLDDLEAAGYLEIVSMVNGFVHMTELGNKVCGLLLAFKANGGQFAQFVLDEALQS
jgi:hypothetical protein